MYLEKLHFLHPSPSLSQVKVDKDDIFASTEVGTESTATAAASTTVKKTKAKGTKKKTKTAKGRPDEDLFGNTDDIFGDLPPATGKSPKPKKKKKKTTAAGDGVPEDTGEQGG